MPVCISINGKVSSIAVKEVSGLRQERPTNNTKDVKKVTKDAMSSSWHHRKSRDFLTDKWITLN